jgi:hypothetical protein
VRSSGQLVLAEVSLKTGVADQGSRKVLRAAVPQLIDDVRHSVWVPETRSTITPPTGIRE